MPAVIVSAVAFAVIVACVAVEEHQDKSCTKFTAATTALLPRRQGHDGENNRPQQGRVTFARIKQENGLFRVNRSGLAATATTNKERNPPWSVPAPQHSTTILHQPPQSIVQPGGLSNSGSLPGHLGAHSATAPKKNHAHKTLAPKQRLSFYMVAKPLRYSIWRLIQQRHNVNCSYPHEESEISSALEKGDEEGKSEKTTRSHAPTSP
jgi:hypothetical protein